MQRRRRNKEVESGKKPTDSNAPPDFQLKASVRILSCFFFVSFLSRSDRTDKTRKVLIF